MFFFQNEVKDQFWVYQERHEPFGPFKQVSGPSSNSIENPKVLPQKAIPQKVIPQI